MKAIRVQHPDRSLELVDVPEPVPGPGQVLIGVESAGVNYGDLLLRSGAYPLPPAGIPGFDVAGQVLAVGDGVSPNRVGSRVVAPLLALGGYAEQAVAEAATAVDLPDGVPSDDAVTVPVQGLTAYLALRDTAALAGGETVLVTAAAGATGHLVVQYARLLGARAVVAAVSTPAKHDAVRRLGADDVVTTGDAEAADRLAAAGGVDVVLDTVGQDVGRWSLRTLGAGGRLVLTAARTPESAAPEQQAHDDDALRRLAAPSQDVRRFPFLGVYTADQLHAAMSTLVGFLAAGAVRPVVTNHPLADAEAAHALLAARRTVGKLALHP